MATQNSYLRRPITLHRRTRAVIFGRGKCLVYRPAGERRPLMIPLK